MVRDDGTLHFVGGLFFIYLFLKGLLFLDCIDHDGEGEEGRNLYLHYGPRLRR